MGLGERAHGGSCCAVLWGRVGKLCLQQHRSCSRCNLGWDLHLAPLAEPGLSVAVGVAGCRLHLCVAGEIGSRLQATEEHQYYDAVASYAGLSALPGVGSAVGHSTAQQHLSGWIWSGYSYGELTAFSGSLQLVSVRVWESNSLHPAPQTLLSAENWGWGCIEGYALMGVVSAIRCGRCVEV
jgi:hypothetical protein